MEKKINKVTLLHSGMIVTMDSQNRVYRNGAILIDGDTIIDIGQSSQLLYNYQDHAHSGIIDLQGKIVLPGFINTHVHTSQQLARGIADDVDLLTWLHKRGQHVSEMARAVEQLGLRACLTQSTMDCGQGLPEKWALHTTEYCIQSQKQLYDKHHDTADGRIKIWLGVRQIMNATDKLLLETRDTAKELKTGIHMHVAEIPYENELVVNTREVAHGTVTYLEKIKVLEGNLLAAHSVWVSDNEIDFLSKAKVKVSHCPAAAMRMLGFAPIKEMLDAGICVSLGTDGAPSNNRMSIVDEMYLASLINKGREAFTKGTTDPTALPAETILKMATINGAESVLWDNEIGSLQARKRADLIIVDPFSWSMVPVNDCISSLVYCMRTENIESVMCNGQWIMKDRKILTVNEGDVLLSAKKASSELLRRAGITIPSRMNVI
ncbi:hypothetical protein AQUCO_01100065v1 [Aquilegia coerulea]|uniref:Amidohydrolase-related domain-containing protein n=1 Tax=Aquilegia coerulea TaxID=218851 RepID=A0A2G5E5G6_AQUCA|nr:hypothetical protein AQUCO_01100065v1 [Aquilegia coerulea]